MTGLTAIGQRLEWGIEWIERLGDESRSISLATGTALAALVLGGGLSAFLLVFLFLVKVLH